MAHEIMPVEGFGDLTALLEQLIRERHARLGQTLLLSTKPRHHPTGLKANGPNSNEPATSQCENPLAVVPAESTKPTMPAVTRSFSAPDDLLEQAEARQKALGLENFSDYIKSLIREDIHRAAAEFQESPPPYKTASPRAKRQ